MGSVKNVIIIEGSHVRKLRPPTKSWKMKTQKPKTPTKSWKTKTQKPKTLEKVGRRRPLKRGNMQSASCGLPVTSRVASGYASCQ